MRVLLLVLVLACTGCTTPGQPVKREVIGEIGAKADPDKDGNLVPALTAKIQIKWGN